MTYDPSIYDPENREEFQRWGNRLEALFYQEADSLPQWLSKGAEDKEFDISSPASSVSELLPFGLKFAEKSPESLMTAFLALQRAALVLILEMLRESGPRREQAS